MAFKIAEIFSRTDAKSRIFIIIATVVGFSALIYFASLFFGGDASVGRARVAVTPTGLQSVPGGQLTQEYSRAVQQSNVQAAQRAQMTGGSAVPTLTNVPGVSSSLQTTTNCTVLCPGDEAADVTGDINDLVKQGKLTQDEANNLLTLAKNNVPVSEYMAALDELVRQGKITPEQARKLLEKYKKQHANVAIAASASTMDDLIKSGKLPLDTATQLLALQKQSASPAQYAAELNRLVREGKISPEVAAQLLAQYTQQKAQEATADSGFALKQMAKSGQITPDVADALTKLQQQNVPVSQYADNLNRMVAEGKMTPAAAAKLLADYQAQRTGMGPASELSGLVAGAEAANAADVNNLVGTGLPPDVANMLTDLQNKNVSPEDYQKALDELVRTGKLSPEAAKQLMAKYREARDLDSGLSNDLATQVSQGKLSQEAADMLGDLQKRNVSPEEYKQALEKLVREGKLSPEAAKALLAKYEALQAAKGGLASLIQGGGLSQAQADSLIDMQKKQVSPKEYHDALDKLVQEGKLKPADAKRLMENYQKLQGLRGMSKTLLDAQGNNLSAAAYADELKRAVQAGIITPETAATLMQQYQAMLARPAGLVPAGVDGGDQDFARLQQQLQEQAQVTTPDQNFQFTAPPTPEAQAANAQVAAQLAAEAEQRRQKHIQDLMTAMSGQAQSMIASWTPSPVMQRKEGVPATKPTDVLPKNTNGKDGTQQTGGGSGQSGASSAPLLKAGTILFAVLDTAVDSDFPETPVMATIVDGKFKGARLLGKLAITQGQDRVMLNFTQISKDEWDRNKTISAVAIDPQTAHTVLASSVDYHYMLRYGTIMATSFLTGYSSAITQEGTSSAGIFGTTSTHPALSPGNKLAVGMGQIGTTMGTAIQSYINTPPTVKVNAGVGLGILFMSDVTDTADVPGAQGASGVPGTQAPANTGVAAVTSTIANAGLATSNPGLPASGFG